MFFGERRIENIIKVIDMADKVVVDRVVIVIEDIGFIIEKFVFWIGIVGVIFGRFDFIY